jgi:aconitase A
MLLAESGLMPYLAATGFHTWINACFAAFAIWLALNAAL